MVKKIQANNFQAIADANGIEIVSFRLPNVGSLSAEVNGRCLIGLDTSQRMTHAEEQAHIGHELGHCLYGGFYSRASPYDLVERHELRADQIPGHKADRDADDREQIRLPPDHAADLPAGRADGF